MEYMLPDMIPAMKKTILDSIDGKKNELDRHRPFSPAVLQKLREQFIIEWTYNSNAIEGNSLTLHETELVLSRGLTIGNKSLKEHFEVINHKEAIQYLESYIEKKQALEENFVKEVHSLILKNIDAVYAGVYRDTSVRILGAIHIPPNPLKIPSLMQELFTWYYENQYTLPIPVLAAMLHYKFVHIHPFVDVNGRTARLIMNLVLMQNGFPPAVILNLDRKKYYRVLRQADLGKFQEYVDFIGKSIERSLVIYLNSIKPANTMSEYQGYISLSEATKYCNYSIEYLSLLARKGMLPAVKFERNWMTTQEAIDDYVNERVKNSGE